MDAKKIAGIKERRARYQVEKEFLKKSGTSSTSTVIKPADIDKLKEELYALGWIGPQIKNAVTLHRKDLANQDIHAFEEATVFNPQLMLGGKKMVIRKKRKNKKK